MNKRRKLLLALSGVSATTVWTRPVVDAVMLPVHAETTDPTDLAPEPTGVVRWQLENVSFNGNTGTASGYFTYNYITAMITDWNIAVSEGSVEREGGTVTFSARSYTMENSTFTSSSTALTFEASDEEDRRILLAPVLSSTAPTDNLSIDLLSLDANNNNFEVAASNAALRKIGSGSLVGTFV